MIYRCEVLWGRVGPHKTGDKIDLSETDADRLLKMGTVRVLCTIDAQPEVIVQTPEARAGENAETQVQTPEARAPVKTRAPKPKTPVAPRSRQKPKKSR